MSRNLIRIVVLAFGYFLCAANARAEDEQILNIGDAPPAITVSDWVKGDKIEKLEPGKTYVVEFWATWCGPCRASIPHLTELAHEYKDKVKFVGVDIWEYDRALVKPFVEEMGEKMDYNIAMDAVPESGDRRNGFMAKNWMDAAGATGIPTSFVVKDGKIAWIGHPNGLAEPLKKIVANDWDYATEAKNRLVELAELRKLREVRDRIITPFNAKKYKETLAALDALAAEDPAMAEKFIGTRFSSLCNAGMIDDGLRIGKQLLTDDWDKVGNCNSHAWDVTDPELDIEPDARVGQLAVQFAARAVELSKSEDSTIIDTLAVAQYRAGDVEKAIATEEKAIAVEKAAKEPSESDIKIYDKRIEWFRSGKKKADPA